MYRRPFFWTSAHVFLSILFGILFLAMMGHLLTTAGVTVTWHWSLVALCLLVGNPFFKLIRYKNGVVVIFFSLLASHNVIFAIQFLFLFSVLVCIRRRFNDLELYERDARLIAENSPPSTARALSKPAQPAGNNVKKRSRRTRLLLDLLRAAEDLLLLTLAAPLILATKSNHTKSDHDVFNFLRTRPHTAGLDDWDVFPTSTDDWGCNMSHTMFSTNPANGLPMATDAFDVMGNSYGFSSSCFSDANGWTI